MRGKTLRKTPWCFFVLQSRVEGLKSKEYYGTDLSHCFSLTVWTVQTVFHAWWYIFCVWEVVRTTVVSQLRGDCSIIWENFMEPGSLHCKVSHSLGNWLSLSYLNFGIFYEQRHESHSQGIKYRPPYIRRKFPKLIMWLTLFSYS